MKWCRCNIGCSVLHIPLQHNLTKPTYRRNMRYFVIRCTQVAAKLCATLRSYPHADPLKGILLACGMYAVRFGRSVPKFQRNLLLIWGQHIRLRRRYTHIRLHGVIPHKAAISTAIARKIPNSTNGDASNYLVSWWVQVIARRILYYVHICVSDCSTLTRKSTRYRNTWRSTRRSWQEMRRRWWTLQGNKIHCW